jgi:aminopeptidase N
LLLLPLACWSLLVEVRFLLEHFKIGVLYLDHLLTMTERVLLPNHLVPSHYALEISPDFDKLTFATTEEIHVTVQEETDRLTLHAREITIHSVSFKSNVSNQEVKLSELSYNFKANTVSFGFDGKLSLGEGVVTIKYTGILNGDMAGFYKSTYADANGNKKIMGSTQFEALDARR